MSYDIIVVNVVRHLRQFSPAQKLCPKTSAIAREQKPPINDHDADMTTNTTTNL
jgi:hypothetical protein